MYLITKLGFVLRGYARHTLHFCRQLRTLYFFYFLCFSICLYFKLDLWIVVIIIGAQFFEIFEAKIGSLLPGNLSIECMKLLLRLWNITKFCLNLTYVATTQRIVFVTIASQKLWYNYIVWWYLWLDFHQRYLIFNFWRLVLRFADIKLRHLDIIMIL